MIFIAIHRPRRSAPLEQAGMIASVSREGLNREHGEGGSLPESTAVPATVSGERDAYRFFLGRKGQPLGRTMRREAWEGHASRDDP
jgi:hypothetical protein